MKDDKTIKQEEFQKIKEDIIEKFKEADKIQRESQEDLDSVVLTMKNETINLLKTQNQKVFKQLLTLTKKIEKLTDEILLNIINDKDFIQLKNEGKIHFELQKELSEAQIEQIEVLNGQFISEKLLMTIPYITGGITKDTLKNFQEDFKFLEDKTKERNKLQNQFYKKYETIQENNRELAIIKTSFLDELPRTDFEELEKETIDLTNPKTLELFREMMTLLNEASIDDQTLFELSQRVDSEYKFNLEYNKETTTIEYNFSKELNFTRKYLDISNPRIKELEKEIKRLQDKLKETEEPEEIQDFKPIPIDKAIAFNDKLSNNLANLENNNFVEIGKTGGKGKKVKDSVMKVLVENGEMTTTKVLEPFDKVVLQSIYSLIQKNQYFDIQMLKEEMSGNKNRHKGQLDEEIEKSVNKMRTTLIQIEIPEEIQGQMKTPFEKIGIKDTILPIREFYVIKGGHKKSVFGFNAKSIYFDYEEARGQLISKNNKLLQGGIGNATKQSIILTDYISTRIEDMKHQQSNKFKKGYIEEIKLETIWNLILTDEDFKLSDKALANKKSRYKNQIKTILNTYKNDKYIKDFEEYSEGFKIKL